MASSAASLLLRQYRELTDPKKGLPGFHIELEDDNIFVWNIGVMVLDKDSAYYGGYFRAQMKFPSDFPFSPPSFRFTPAIYHPNVYRDGRLCISILHRSGDPTSDEPDAETWSPAQSVETVLISIVSLLEDPNPLSPANVDAAVDFRSRPDEYKKKVQFEVERSKQDIPAGFVMPTEEEAYLSASAPPVEEDVVDENFWYDSEEDEDDDESYDDDSIMDDVDNEEDEEAEAEADMENSQK